MKFHLLWRYFPAMKHYLIASVLIFSVGAYIGFSSPDQFQFILQAQQEHLKTIADQIHNSQHPQASLFGMILLNNVLAVTATLFMGVMFMVVPIYFLLTNGAMLGYMANAFASKQQLGTFWSGILPHGIIEIPTVILAAAFGVRLGVLMMKAIIALPYGSRRVRLKEEMRTFFQALVPLIPLLFGLLLIAAAVESTLTVWLSGK